MVGFPVELRTYRPRYGTDLIRTLSHPSTLFDFQPSSPKEAITLYFRIYHNEAIIDGNTKNYHDVKMVIFITYRHTLKTFSFLTSLSSHRINRFATRTSSVEIIYWSVVRMDM